MRGGCPLVTLVGGESAKSLPTTRRIWKKLWQYRVDKGQVVLLVGGGSLLDVGSFCCSTWKRGISYISVPTTLIAQIDAAIGGKTGINFKGAKNLIGTFWEPQALWVYVGFLRSLPERELRSGWVEVYKHALLVGGALWEEVQAQSFREVPDLCWVEKAAEVKLKWVAQDPREEKGIRLFLNLGHTLGHVWEALSLSTSAPLLHGEAVAIGLLQEAYVSMRRGLLSPLHFERIQQKLHSEGLMAPLPPFTWHQWEKVLLQDKKIWGGQLTLPLLRGPGEVERTVVSVEELRKAVQWYRHEVGKGGIYGHSVA
ncbi:MAG: 3-dehydroquinate synthase [Bacteroidia bacterium]|nr:3-dehydroquinate synthase [Bacteroidia bacterium]